MNKLTVLMSVYNDKKYLRESVKSILNQTLKEFEFVIIDDGSEENIKQVISEFSDPRIKYIRTEHRGLAAALNFGLKHSTGDLIARIDADDISTPDRLEKQMHFMNLNPDIDVAGSRSVYFNEDKEILFAVRPPEDETSIKQFLNLHNPLNHSTVIFRKEKISSGGGYDESFMCYEDFELWFRMRDKIKFAVMPEVLAFTLLRKDSMTAKGSTAKIYSVLMSNATVKLGSGVSDNEKKFWHNILFRIEYFYGDKNRAREYFPAGLNFANISAYLMTLLPEKIFRRIAMARIKYRIQTSRSEKKEYKSQLINILSN